MKLINEDFFNKWLQDEFQGNPVRFRVNKFTGTVHINADDVSQICMGMDFNTFLATDKGLDFINDWKREHPDIPFFGGAVIRTNHP